MKAKIAVLAGDGVGREIVPEAVKVLKIIAEKYGHSFEFVAADIGGQAIDKVGVPLPKAFMRPAQATSRGRRSSGGTGLPPPSRTSRNHTGL